METKDNLGRIVLTESDCINLLLNGKQIDSVYVNDKNLADEYNRINEEEYGMDSVLNVLEENVSVDEYHQSKTNTWNIPDKYKSINVKEFVLEKAKTPEEIERVEQEYRMYEERELIDIIRCIIYLIDYFRENEIVWGVGRGSSVSSYILYLIGVHKVNSLKYDLDINEFLK
jgi:DNA polymerase III alpha subunit